MHIRPFETHDLKAMVSWLTERKAYIPRPTEMPATGFIVEDIACGFLRMVEGGYAQIDGYVTNPKASGPLRHEAQDLLTTTLIDAAKSKGILMLIANSEYSRTLVRATKHGFKLLPTTLIALDLRSL